MLVRQKRVWPLLITTFMLMSCVDFEGMGEDVAKAKVAIEKEFGGRSLFLGKWLTER